MKLILDRLLKTVELDAVAAQNVFLLSTTWFFCAYHVLNSVFIMEPDNTGYIKLENTVQGSFIDPDDSSALAKISIAQIIIFVGWLFGSSLLSPFSDSHGRKPAFLLCAVILTAGTLLQLLAWNIMVFICGRFITGAGVGGIGVVAFCWGCEWMITSSLNSLHGSGNLDDPADTILVEDDDRSIVSRLPKSPINPNGYQSLDSRDGYGNSYEQEKSLERGDGDELKRQYPKASSTPTANTFGSTWFQIVWAIGGTFIPLISYLLPYWRTNLGFSLVASVIPFIGIMYTVAESPRWLVSTGRIERYEKVMSLSYGQDYSNTFHPDEPTSAETASSSLIPNEPTEKASFKDFLTAPLIYITVGLSFIWLANAFVYYGVFLNANKLPGNVYVTSGLMSVLGIPGLLSSIPLEKRLGTLNSFVYSMFTCSLVFLAMTLVSIFMFDPNSLLYVILITGFSLLGTFMCAIQFSLCYIVTFDAFDTRVRNTGMGIGVTMGRVGAMICPVVAVWGQNEDGSMGWKSEFILSLIIGMASFVAILTLRKAL